MLEGGSPASVLSLTDYTSLLETYQLVELSQSVMWANKTNTSLFSTPTLTVAGGVSALKFFVSNLDPNQANPPRGWDGNQVCKVGFCFNFWFQDGTNQTDPIRGYPTTPYGTFLANPGTDVSTRFTGLLDTGEPLRYDPYVASPPDYNPYHPLAAYIDGPQMVPSGFSQTWNAGISGGTAPYTVQWSGLLSGSATSVSGNPTDSGTLYLDVWDAVGAHVAVSVYVTVCQNGQISC